MTWQTDRRVPDTKTNLRDKVLRTFGVDQSQDTELQTLALDFLDQAVKEMNMHLYEFNKHTEASIALSASNNYVTLTSSTVDVDLDAGTTTNKLVPYKEVQAYLVATSGGARTGLTYLPWTRFSERIASPIYGTSGTPEVYSWRNIEADGKVSLHPAPSASAVSTYTLTLEFYRRIPLVSYLSADAKQLTVPEEVETPLVWNACMRMAIHLYGPGHEDVQGFRALEQQALAELKAVDKRHPDQQLRFRNIDNVARSGGRNSPLLIRI